MMSLPTAEHCAKLASALAAGDPIMLYVKAAADNPGTVDGDVGVWAWVMKEVTGEEAYARAAITRALLYLTPEPTWGRNELRATTLQWIWMGVRLRPQMSPEEWETWDSRVKYRLSLMLQPEGTGWGVRIGDSDEVISAYYALAAYDHFHGTSYLTDPVAEGATNPSAMRAEIVRMVSLAWGGEWIAGGEYQANDLALLFTGNCFAPIPEVANLLPDALTQFRWTTTLDLKPIQWGDVRTPGWFSYSEIGLLALMTGLTQDGQGHALFNLLTPDGFHGRHHSMWWALLMGFDPSKASPKYQPPVGFRATGAGLTQHRGPRHHFWFKDASDFGIDHYVYHTGTCGLILDGVRRLWHPLLYQGNAPAHNTVLFSGLRERLSSIGPNVAMGDDAGCRIIQRSTGPAQNPRGDMAPAENFVNYVGDVVFTPPGRIEFKDRFTGHAPTDVDHYRDYQQADINGRWMLWQRVFHSETDEIPVTHGWPESMVFAGSSGVAGNDGGSQLGGYQIRVGSDVEGDVEYSAVFDAETGPSPPPPPPPPNSPPVLLDLPDQTIVVGQVFSVSIIATDPDDDPLVFAASPDSAVIGVDLEGNLLTVTALAVGSATVTVTADDNKGGSATDTFTVTVVESPPPPPVETWEQIGDEAVSKEYGPDVREMSRIVRRV